METGAQDAGPLLRARNVYVLELNSAIAVRRGRLEFHISGAGAHAILSHILECAAGPGMRKEEMLATVHEDGRAAVDDLIERLIERDILYSVGTSSDEGNIDEPPLEIFYWHFGSNARAISDHMRAREIFLIGVNEISASMAAAFGAAGLAQVRIIDDHALRGPSSGSELVKRTLQIDDVSVLRDRTIDSNPICAVATSGSPNRRALRDWNLWAVENDVHFYAVMMDDLAGYAGPLVIPGQTPCFECLQSRLNSNLSSPPYTQSEAKVDGAALAHGYHPAMVSMLANMAVMEITKLYGGLPESRAADMIEIDFVGRVMRPHRVLKVPRCAVCSGTLARSRTSITTDEMIPQLRYSQLFAE